MDKLQNYLGHLFASLALKAGTSSVNSACVLYVYQPKVPKAMDKFKK